MKQCIRHVETDTPQILPHSERGRGRPFQTSSSTVVSGGAVERYLKFQDIWFSLTASSAVSATLSAVPSCPHPQQNNNAQTNPRLPGQKGEEMIRMGKVGQRMYEMTEGEWAGSVSWLCPFLTDLGQPLSHPASPSPFQGGVPRVLDKGPILCMWKFLVFCNTLSTNFIAGISKFIHVHQQMKGHNRQPQCGGKLR